MNIPSPCQEALTQQIALSVPSDVYMSDTFPEPSIRKIRWLLDRAYFQLDSIDIWYGRVKSAYTKACV